MPEVKKYRKIQKEVMAVQITSELIASGAGFGDKVIINPATRKVVLERSSPPFTGGISDWIILDDDGTASIMSPAEFAREYEEVKEEENTKTLNSSEAVYGVDMGQVPTEDTEDAGNSGGDTVAE